MTDRLKRKPSGINLNAIEQSLLKDLTTADPLQGKRSKARVVAELIQKEHKRLVPEKWEGSEYIGP